jgi:pimeloyl-ACP methyl ester carboxylesterase
MTATLFGEHDALAPQTGPRICLGDKVTKAAWHDKPSWWVLSAKDQIIDPRLQQGMAAAAKATVTTVQSSHVAMLSRPDEVAATIVAAANSIEPVIGHCANL